MEKQLVIRNVQTVQGTSMDIVVENGRIAAITPANSAQGDKVYDGSGQYVSSGWIDMHVHAVPGLDPTVTKLMRLASSKG